MLGATVNYDTGTELATDITWKIFYIDESNVYIIADDYVLAEDAPETSSGYSPIYSEDYPYGLYLNYVENDYTGSADWDSTVSYWNTLYLSSYPNSTKSNAQAVAYLLDTDLWSDFANNSYAKYAIGSPTIEMWVASWNQHGYTTLYCNNINSYGYYIGTSDTPTDYFVSVLEDSDILYFNDPDGEYDTDYGAYGYWLASSASSTSAIMQVEWDGSVMYGTTYGIRSAYCTGFRPVVCLSSSVCLTLEEDGTYSIN